MADIKGKPALVRVIERLRRCRSVDQVMLATTTNPQDDVLAEVAGVPVYRGSETDVLGRYAAAARLIGADVVVRITADCPLLDPNVVDRAVYMLKDGVDFVSNAIVRTFPRGLDVEVMHVDVLQRINRMAYTPNSREHVCTFIYQEQPALFSVRQLKDIDDNSTLSWELNTEDDLRYIRSIYDDCDYRELVKRCLVGSREKAQ